MAPNTFQFKKDLAERLTLGAYRKVRPRVARASRTLANAMERRVEAESRSRGDVVGVLYIPHYWAVYVHDGRRPFSKSSYMVWWKNPKEDPRLSGGVAPKRARNLKRLTRNQWLEAVRRRQEWIDAGGDAYDAPVIITRVIRRRTRPDKFFGNRRGGGLQGYVNTANKIGQKKFSRYVRDVLGEGFRETSSARGVLR